MITIKELEKDEHLAFKTISKFIDDHPLLIFIGGGFVIMFIMLALANVMVLATLGGATIEHNVQEQFLTGNMSEHQYILTMQAIGIAFWFYQFVNVLITLMVGVFILILLYVTFKEYLKYKRDVL